MTRDVHCVNLFQVKTGKNYFCDNVQVKLGTPVALRLSQKNQKLVLHFAFVMNSTTQFRLWNLLIICGYFFVRTPANTYGAFSSGPNSARRSNKHYGNGSTSVQSQARVNSVPSSTPVVTAVNATVTAQVHTSVGMLPQNLQHLSVSQPSLTHIAHQQYNIADGGVTSVSNNPANFSLAMNHEHLTTAGQSVHQTSVVGQSVKRSASFNVPSLISQNQTSPVIPGKMIVLSLFLVAIIGKVGCY